MNESPTIMTRTINTDIPDNILEAAWIVAVALHRKWHLMDRSPRLEPPSAVVVRRNPFG